MDILHVFAALVSALLHAGWNAAVKASPQPRHAMAAQLVVSGLIALPGLAFTGLPARASWIWIAMSVTLNLIALTALLRAYALIGFGAAYPVVRAISVVLVVPLAAHLSGEAMSPSGFAGVALISASLLLLALGNAGPNAVPRAALFWIVAAGIITAAYVTCDARGVRLAGSPLAYGFAVTFANGATMSLLALSSAGGSLRAIARHAPRAFPMAAAAVVSYLLILWVWSVAPIAPAAALRDTSAAFAILIAILWLEEPFTRLRLCAIVLSAAAVPLLRFA
jgi:multidrug transporter EmrE-like cation transporter